MPLRCDTSKLAFNGAICVISFDYGKFYFQRISLRFFHVCQRQRPFLCVRVLLKSTANDLILSTSTFSFIQKFIGQLHSAITFKTSDSRLLTFADCRAGRASSRRHRWPPEASWTATTAPTTKRDDGGDATACWSGSATCSSNGWMASSCGYCSLDCCCCCCSSWIRWSCYCCYWCSWCCFAEGSRTLSAIYGCYYYCSMDLSDQNRRRFYLQGEKIKKNVRPSKFLRIRTMFSKFKPFCIFKFNFVLFSNLWHLSENCFCFFNCF